MKISGAFPSKFLKSADLQDRDVNVVMSHVDMEDVGDTDKKPVLYFVGKQKGVVLNKTNSKIIAKSYGDDTEAWRTKPITLYPAMVEFKGDMVEAIRVRVPKENGSAAPAGATEINPPPQDMDDEIPF